MSSAETPSDVEKGPRPLTPGVSSEAAPSPIVDWNGPNDASNPMNWSSRRKWLSVALVSAVTFNISLASTVFAPGVPKLMAEFHSSNELLASFTVSVYIAAFIFGPLVFAPLSELYGRSAVMHTSNLMFLIFTVACAVSTNMAMFIVFRLFQGLAGCVPLTLGGGTIADLMPPDKRGRALSGWQLGPLLGPVIGPVVGGYLAQRAGWRWIIWLVAIFSGVLTVACFLFLRETYAPTLLGRKAARLRKQTGDLSLKSKFDQGRTPKELFSKAIVRPTKMLFLSPIVMILALDVSLVYAYLYLLFTTFTFVFEDQYGFKAGPAGLAYLGLGIGFLLGLFGTGAFSDHYAKKKAEGKEIKPEHRLPPLIIGAFFVPVGLFWYGWTAEYKVHWIVPIIGTSFIGFGVLCVFMPIQAYLIDAFTIYAASAIASNTVVRSLFGAVLPLAGQSMYAKLGLGWGNSLLGFIALATVPVPFLLLKYGERIRSSPRFKLDL